MRWQKLVEREGDFFKNVLLYESLAEHFPSVFARHHPPFLTVRKGDIFIHYQDEEGRKEFAQFLEGQSQEFIEQIITAGKKHFQELTAFCQNIYDQKIPNQKIPNFTRCSDQELAELLQTYCSLYKKPYPYFNLSPFADYVSDPYLVQAMGEWRFWARDRFNHVHELAEPLFQEMAQRLHLTVKELKFLKPPEIIEGLLKHHKIQCRQRCYFHFENGSFVLKEDAAPEFLEEETEEEAETSVLHGHGTFQAKVNGIVRVIHRKEDLLNVQLGEILVLRMTTPDLMMESIKKAGAIITDEGGITSHAAVLSREFKIPALMGTRRGTKVFKTGELVEVDTGKGIVRRV